MIFSFWPLCHSIDWSLLSTLMPRHRRFILFFCQKKEPFKQPSRAGRPQLLQILQALDLGSSCRNQKNMQKFFLKVEETPDGYFSFGKSCKSGFVVYECPESVTCIHASSFPHIETRAYDFLGCSFLTCMPFLVHLPFCFDDKYYPALDTVAHDYLRDSSTTKVRSLARFWSHCTGSCIMRASDFISLWKCFHPVDSVCLISNDRSSRF